MTAAGRSDLRPARFTVDLFRAPAVDEHVQQPHIRPRGACCGLQSRHARRGREPLETSQPHYDGFGRYAPSDEEPLVRRRRRAAPIGRARRGIDEHARKPFVEPHCRLGRVRLSHEIREPQRYAAVDARIEVDPRARQALGSELRFRRETLERLARASGGQAYFPATVDELPAQYAHVVEDLRRRYVLSYTSTNSTRDGKWRQVELRPRREGLSITSRGGYRAPAR